MSPIEYTREDLLRLTEFLAPSSIIPSILERCDYDPVVLRESLWVLKKEHAFIYETPLKELPLTISDPRFEGWRKWRLSIGK